MRQGVLELREFYATPLGRMARQMVSRKVVEAWGDARGLDLQDRSSRVRVYLHTRYNRRIINTCCSASTTATAGNVILCRSYIASISVRYYNFVSAGSAQN